MSKIEIPVVLIQDFHAGGEARERFIKTVGDSLRDIGFFAVADHGISPELLRSCYASAETFFDLPKETKQESQPKGASGQRGYTGLYVEHAKDSEAPDVKEFYQVGRVDVPDDHVVHKPYGPNVWPTAVPDFESNLSSLYKAQNALGATLLEACALYIGEDKNLMTDMVAEGDTIIRVLFYPPLPADAPDGAIRAAAHEDINLITLLPGATASGLELLGRDGTWLEVAAQHDHIVVDSGDMLQNLSNGLFRSTTHRVVNPEDRSSKRYSMPCFIHPERDADLTPLASCVEKTGGEAQFPSLSAGQYLRQRLEEIGLELP